MSLSRHALLLGALLLGGAGQAQEGPEDRALPAQDAPAALPQAQAITLTFTLPDRVQEVLIRVPTPVVPGSVQVNGQAAADPEMGEAGSLFRLSQPGITLTLRFSVAEVGVVQAPDVAVLYETGLSETLGGTLTYTPGKPSAPAVPLREGLIRSPAQGAVLSGRSSVNVLTRTALDADLSLRVNGVAVSESQIGRRVDDPNAEETTREFIGVNLKPGINTLTAESGGVTDTLTVQVAGSAQGARAKNVRAVADGYTPVKLAVEVVDAQGLPTVVPTVTVESAGALRLTTPDADLAQSGHQIAVVGSEALLTFAPRSTPGSTQVILNVNAHPVTLPLTVLATTRRTVVGVASATFQVPDGRLEAQGEARFTVEAPIQGGQLTVNVDSSGAHTDIPADTRFPSLGDSGQSGRPLEADGVFAARYDHPLFTALYARNAAQDPVFASPDSGDTLRVTTQGQTRVTAYLAPFAGNTLEVELPLTGTRIARLPLSLDPLRVRLFLRTTRQGVSTEEELQRGQDFVIDDAGNVTFARPLPPAPGPDVDVRLLVRGPSADHSLNPAGLLAVSRDVSWGEAQGTLSAGVHASATDVTLGARLNVADGSGPLTYRAEAAAAVTPGDRLTRAQLQADGAAPAFGVTWALSAAHEDVGYQGQGGTGQAGQSLAGSVTRKVTSQFGVRADVQAQRTSQGSGARAGLTAEYSPSARWQFTGGVFSGTGTLEGTGINAGVRWKEGPYSARLDAQQNVTTGSGLYSAQVSRLVPLPQGTPPGAELAVGARVTAAVQDGDIQVTSGAVLSGRAGPYTATLEYALPSVGGEEGQARGSVQATFPLRPGLNLGAQVSAAPDVQQGSVDLRLNTPRTVATASVDVSRSAAGAQPGVSTAARFSVSHALRPAPTPFGLTADGLSVLTPGGAGHRYSAGLTYRGEDVQAAAYLRYRAGVLTALQTGQELGAELNLTYHTPQTQTRGQLALKAVPGDPQSLTAQGILAGQYWLTPNLGVGAAYRGLYQPATQAAAHAFGIESTYRILPEAGLTLGYNFGGFPSLTAEPTRPGAYLRLDFVFDDFSGDRK
ncbi:hypothetical protein QOL99_02340 [Deinococcus sp. MIMF12]|uniref:Uncharacterized protein n=1 Tax=Deinococcus rhizophilus TaxID=3049544 RepID=A0ABT7JG96_9DEIO|nr:hypothetical protein [Deinococcus rhizophilus]MDL2342983.1 hypothetical protein [Deinococcus rhizophilus]